MDQSIKRRKGVEIQHIAVGVDEKAKVYGEKVIKFIFTHREEILQAPTTNHQQEIRNFRGP